jgi:hypothetical protein
MLPATSKGPENPEPVDVPAAALRVSVGDDIVKALEYKIQSGTYRLFFSIFIN